MVFLLRVVNGVPSSPAVNSENFPPLGKDSLPFPKTSSAMPSQSLSPLSSQPSRVLPVPWGVAAASARAPVGVPPSRWSSPFFDVAVKLNFVAPCIKDG